MSVHKLPTSTNDLEKAQARRPAVDIFDSGPPPHSGSESDSSSTGEDDDDDWNDWISDSENKKACLSLFDGSAHPSVDAALAHDKQTRGVDFEALTIRLHLDFHGRARLVNYIRKEKPSSIDVNALTGQEAFFTSDEYLIPIVQDDPLLQVGSDDWSEDEYEEATSVKVQDKDRIIRSLNRRLEQAKRDLVDYRALVEKQYRVSEITQVLEEDKAGPAAGPSSKSGITEKRDDDTHYFNSYGDNEIHYVMLRDKVRTSTYASFILNSPELFRDAIVLDVGCGTGILSLFAARAGAKRVFAVDASESITQKAKKIIKANGLDDVITVINSKVENITLPDGITHVDVIISEWMGYALLYESMLDSVLVARDRFLRPVGASAHATVDEERGRDAGEKTKEEVKGGVLAPSQTRILLGLCSANDIVKDRIEFWSDVYGYDMSPMAEGVYDEAVIDVVEPETMLTDAVIVKDINIATTTLRQLSFSAPFSLQGTSARRTVAHAFILYFDAFFTEDGAQVTPDVRAHAARNGEPVLAEVWRPGSPSRSRARSPSSPTSPARAERFRRASSGKVRRQEPWKSFTTGPESEPTHWKQTMFLLKEPIVINDDTVVSGTFHCRKSADNSRELDVEIHYVTRTTDSDTGASEESAMVVQSFKVR